jgi:hypothetical protein
MRKLEINFITSGNESEKSVLVAWDFDERLYKKIHFIAQAVLKNHNLKPVEMKSPWPHISAAYIKGVLTPDERHKFVLAANAIKPKFKFKQFDILSGKDFDYLVLEFFVPAEFKKFEEFAEDVCGKERISKYAETRPHVSIWAVEKKDTPEFKKILPEIKEETKKYLWPFVPVKVSFWVDFEIDEIASIAFLMQEPSWYVRVKSKYELVVAEQTMTLWHGGNLEFAQENISHKGGRWEHGPGLYLTTHYDTARKYSKGSRKLYRIVIRKGTNITEVNIPIAVVREFMDTYFVRSRKKDVAERIEKRIKDDKINADTFLNITFNEQAIKNTDTDKLREFLVKQGVDYSIVDNAFGWHERMIVLFNMKNIISKKIVPPKEKIETYDLPTEWGK